MKDRLIELLGKADEATEILTGDFPSYEEELQAFYSGIADYLLDNGVIVLPCAEGDTVYWIAESDACLFCNSPCYERCEEGALKIKEIPFKLHMLDEIGEIIFITEEDAEAKLKELENDY